MHGSRTASIPPNTLAEFYSFAFIPSTPADPGNFSLSLSLSGAPDTFAWGLLCTEEELSSNILTFPDASALCAAGLSGLCTATAMLRSGNGSWAAWAPVTAATTLHFCVAACATGGSSSMSLSGAWDARNPGGENLPAGDIPLKALTVGFGAAWAALLGALAANLAWAATWQRPPPPGELLALEDAQLASWVRPIHWALLAPPALFCAEGFLGGAYWRSLSATGNENLPLALGDAAAWDGASVALLGVVVALSRGWQVTRLHLSAGEWRSTGALLGGYVGAWLWWSFFPSFLSLFALFLAYTMILRFAFAASSFSLRLLLLFSSFSASLGPAQAGQARGGVGAGAGAGAAQQQPSLWQRALRSVGLGRGGGGGGGEYTAVGEEGGGGAAGDGDPEPAGAAPQPPSLVDGGLSDRQIRFLFTFRWATALYISAVRGAGAPLSPALLPPTPPRVPLFPPPL